MKQAVTIGCACGHGSGGQVSTGSSDVSIGGKSMARRDDSHTCPKHGEPTFVAGAGRVLVNGRPALRQGVDPSSCGAVVSRGVPHVWIGEDPIGMGRYQLKNPPPPPPPTDEARALNSLGFNDPVQARKLCSALQELKKIYGTLTPEQRRAALEGILNDRLREMGVPPVRVIPANLPGLQTGLFDGSTWTVTVSAQQLADPNGLSEVARQLYHEGTHTGQTFAMALYIALVGKLQANPVYDGSDAGLAKFLGIPRNVATAAITRLNTLNKNGQLQAWLASPEGLAGKLVYDTMLGIGAAHFREVQDRTARELSNPQQYGHTPQDLKIIADTYQALPTENAAYRAEYGFMNACKLG